MTETRDEEALSQMFEAARQSAPAPEADFMARLTADAETFMPRPPAPAAPLQQGRLWRLLEGWGGFAALASTAAMGVWIGIALPETADLPGANLIGIGTDVSALLPGYGADFLGEE